MYRLALALILIAGLNSCHKKNSAPDPNAKQFTFESLTSDVSVLKQGDLTNIRAKVDGTGISYSWSASAGDLLGSGNYIAFGAGSCCTGNHTITCTVSDSHNNSESKSVVINVHQ
jgi:hypothetical protein